jgi:TRAP-type C4-dicarboxylate transport system permease small subunit
VEKEGCNLAHEITESRFSAVFAVACKFADGVNNVVKIIGGIILCTMSIAVFASVVSRYFANISLTWVEEAATFGMAWLCTLGGGLATRKGDMTAVTLGIMFLPPKIQKICRVASCLFCLILFVFILDAGVKMAVVARMQRSPSIPQLTMFWVYVALPVGLVIMFINTTIRMIEICANKGGRK